MSLDYWNCVLALNSLKSTSAGWNWKHLMKLKIKSFKIKYLLPFLEYGIAPQIFSYKTCTCVQACVDI